MQRDDQGGCGTRWGRSDIWLRGSAIIAILTTALLSAACADLPYREFSESPCVLKPQLEEQNGVATRIWESSTGPCPRASLVMHRGEESGAGAHSVSYVEVDEQGILADRRAAEQAIRVATAPPAPGRRASYVVVFIHGWHHDAHPDDSNVQGFHDALASLADWHPTVEVRGIYIGWKGESIPVFPLNYLLTFWSRKGTSEEVGRGMLTEFLLRLEQGVKGGRSSNRLVLIGHSFGASVSFNALSSVYLTRFMQGLERAEGDGAEKGEKGDKGDRAAEWVERPPSAAVRATGSSSSRPTRTYTGRQRSRFAGYGDMVVLINPAIEAMRFMPLQSAIHYYKGPNPSGLRADFSEETRPNLLVLSSQGDWATRKTFEWARVITTLREAHNFLPEGAGGVVGAVPTTTATAEAAAGADAGAGAGAGAGSERGPGDSEWVMDRRTVGNYDRFHTHEALGIRPAEVRGGDLSVKGEPAPSAVLKDCPMVGRAEVRRTLFETPGTPVTFTGSQVSMSRKAGHPDGSPYLLLDVGTELIANHTSIGNPNFICWVNQMVDAND